MRQLIFVAAVLLASAASAVAQDPVKVDPKHYKIEFENDRLRVVRITVGPHETSVMHEHPAGVAVFLTDGRAKHTTPDGKAQEDNFKAGTVAWSEAYKHLPENTGDKAFELVVVELKPALRK